MGEPIKDIYTSEFISEFGNRVKSEYKEFLCEEFAASILAFPWNELPIHARMNRIAKILGEYLPEEYEDALEVLFTIDRKKQAHIRLEYGIDFIKSNGKPSRKLFFISDKKTAGNVQLSGTQTHSFADLTTRRHYPGMHQIVLILNGQEIANTTLLLR